MILSLLSLSRGDDESNQPPSVVDDERRRRMKKCVVEEEREASLLVVACPDVSMVSSKAPIAKECDDDDESFTAASTVTAESENDDQSDLSSACASGPSGVRFDLEATETHEIPSCRDWTDKQRKTRWYTKPEYARLRRRLERDVRRVYHDVPNLLALLPPLDGGADARETDQQTAIGLEIYAHKAGLRRQQYRRQATLKILRASTTSTIPTTKGHRRHHQHHHHHLQRVATRVSRRCVRQAAERAAFNERAIRQDLDLARVHAVCLEEALQTQGTPREADVPVQPDGAWQFCKTLLLDA